MEYKWRESGVWNTEINIYSEKVRTGAKAPVLFILLIKNLYKHKNMTLSQYVA